LLKKSANAVNMEKGYTECVGEDTMRRMTLGRRSRIYGMLPRFLRPGGPNKRYKGRNILIWQEVNHT
jgi:hypothetical protein